MFGLPRKSLEIVFREHTKDTKKIVLNKLKFCATNFSAASDVSVYQKHLQALFKAGVMPVSSKNKLAVAVIEESLGGKIMHLESAVMSAIEYIAQNHVIVQVNQRNVSPGGKRIMLVPPKHIPEWDSLNQIQETKALYSALEAGTTSIWKQQGNNKDNKISDSYKLSCLFSGMKSANPKGIPKMHKGVLVLFMEKTWNDLKLKPLIAFTPMNKDGFMLLIWVPNFAKWQGKPKGSPGKYYLYIPYGTLVFLPGDVVHAEGSCFGGGIKVQKDTTKCSQKFTNHCLHFFLFPDKESVENPV